MKRKPSTVEESISAALFVVEDKLADREV